MSINHFSAEGLWWGQQPQYHHQNHHNMDTSPKSSSGTTTVTNSASFWGNSQFHRHPIASSTNPSHSSLNFDLNNEDDEETVDEHPDGETLHRHRNFKAGEAELEKEIPKEPLFEKPLTPSDVGKLNRLVIPKQHAEKYFPLNGNESGGEKGLLLSFEDELGKPWRFRYSYWNSSQSYVLTKGWSRFVKEKRLDAGDVVLFERHRLDGERLFIGWRRRNAAVAAAAVQDSFAGVGQAAVSGGAGAANGWTRVYFSSGHSNPYPAAAQQAHQNHHRHGHGPGFPYQPDCLHAGGAVSVGQQNQTTTSANSKTLRLFGVNLECQQQPDEVDSDQFQPQQSASSSTLLGLSHHHDSDQQGQQGYYQFQYYPTKVHHPAYFNHHNHMNINFSRETSQTKYWQG